MYRSFVLFITSISVFLLIAANVFAATTVPQVVVSIKPLHSLVAAVMGDLGKPGLIVKQAGSEHGYALKPSDAQMMAKADLIFIANPQMELFLNKPIESLAVQGRVIHLSDTPELRLLSIREGGYFENHEHGNDAHHYAPDFHFWLDPENAKKIVLYVADVLAKKDAAHAMIYHDNAIHYNNEIDALSRDIANSLSPVSKNNFIVFHDAYHYFEDRFGLHAVGSVSIDPEHQPGVKRINAIRQLIVEKNVTCVFSEPQFPNKLINVVVENTDARIGVLDPLGMSLNEGADLYPRLMIMLRDNFVHCLSGDRKLQ